MLKPESGYVIVTGSAGLIAKQIRALPGWLECSLRCRLEKLMRADEGY